MFEGMALDDIKIAMKIVLMRIMMIKKKMVTMIFMTKRMMIRVIMGTTMVT